MTELEQLEAQRTAYAGKILGLGMQIAGIFLVPVLIVVGLHKFFDLSFIKLFPLAFIASWVMVYFLYKKISTETRALDTRIKELRKQEQNNNAPDALQ